MSIINNIIILTRGDTYEFDVTIEDENAPEGRYRLQGNDALYFGVVDPGQPFENGLIRKKFTAVDTDAMGNLIITIEPEDTVDLAPGKYFYSIKLHKNHEEIDLNTNEPTGKLIDKVITVVNKTKFIICD